MDFGFLYQTDFSDHGSSKKPKNPCTLEVDSSVPLTHHDPRDLGLICQVKKRKIRLRIFSLLDLRI